MKKIIWISVLFFWTVSCSVKKEVKPVVEEKPIQREKEKMVEEVKEPERVLASVIKMEIPRVENRSNQVRVNVYATRPDITYSREEIELKKMETGYTIKIWLVRDQLKPASSIDFFKEVIFEIPENGGYDIEVVGKDSNFIDIVFID
ncbi:MAG TPA: hypothetical protein DHW82_10880 [Spirochaetia bacterium]|nr:MAG: hypothetical protein A2Y41_11565 [Spirochaetes bacterium GWB1_36_13]HCL57497.1 hypothetical protein [Spirochaetia bacterium]